MRLLKDIRSVFPPGTEHLSTEELLRCLTGLAEAPWADLRGKALDDRGLARLLRPYEVKSKNIRIHEYGDPDGRVVKGYERVVFADSWERYLAPEGRLDPDGDEGSRVSYPSSESATSATRQEPATDKGVLTCDVAHVAPVAELRGDDSDVAHDQRCIMAEVDHSPLDGTRPSHRRVAI